MVKALLRCWDPAGAAREHAAGLPALLGRAAATGGLAIALEDDGVSARHCELREEGDGMAVVDLDSRNGTRVRGQGIKSRIAVRVGAGDVIEVGKSRVEILAVIFEQAQGASQAFEPMTPVPIPSDAEYSDRGDDDDDGIVIEDHPGEGDCEPHGACYKCKRDLNHLSKADALHHIVDCHSEQLSCPCCQQSLQGLSEAAAARHIDACEAPPACPLCSVLWFTWDPSEKTEHASVCEGASTKTVKRAKKTPAVRAAAASKLSSSQFFKQVSKPKSRLAWAQSEVASTRVQLAAVKGSLDSADWGIKALALRKDLATTERVLADRSNYSAWLQGESMDPNWADKREELLRKEIEIATSLRCELDAHIRALTVEANALAVHLRGGSATTKGVAGATPVPAPPLCSPRLASMSSSM